LPRGFLSGKSNALMDEGEMTLKLRIETHYSSPTAAEPVVERLLFRLINVRFWRLSLINSEQTEI